MELAVAKSLIEQGIDQQLPNQVWADLGSGEGLFTNALADILPSGSKIVALDRDDKAVRSIAFSRIEIALRTVKADLNHLPGDLPLCDGIIMANSLHYVIDQARLLDQLRLVHLKSTGTLILIEYDLEKSNPWVPYPISKKTLGLVAAEAGFQSPVFTRAVKSRLNSSEIYAALLKPNR
ncbi:MAG TPA: methyltransferase domain-containing protein [Chryseosolibacter sp.]